MKKLNWGSKIAIGASIYVVGILSFVAFSTTQKINLVSKDYYPEEIEYQTRIEKIKNTHSLSEKIMVKQTNGMLTLSFPKELESGVEGEIIFYRPADYEKDVRLDIDLAENRSQNINTAKLLPGRYNLKIEWTAQGKEYFQEEAVFINK